MKTTEPRADTRKPAMHANAWREIVQSGAECAQIEGFALEHLIDFQRDRMRIAGDGQ